MNVRIIDSLPPAPRAFSLRHGWVGRQTTVIVERRRPQAACSREAARRPPTWCGRLCLPISPELTYELERLVEAQAAHDHARITRAKARVEARRRQEHLLATREASRRKALERAERERLEWERHMLERLDERRAAHVSASRKKARSHFEAERERNRLREYTRGVRRGPRA